ncbi:MAG: cytochrome c-type biogenesis protein [Chloroflexota bacterium]
MRGYLGWIGILGLLVIGGLALMRFGASPAPSSLSARTRAVALQLRCPVCQGESVADAPSELAKQMRAIIRHQLQQGRTPAQIKSYFVSRYSDWILEAPPSNGIGQVAWLAPPLLLLGGLALLASLIWEWRREGTSTQASMQGVGSDGSGP